MSGLTPHSPFICDMCDEQATFITQVRILDLQQKFFQNGRLGSSLKKIWPPTKVVSKWEMGSTEKFMASNKSSFKVGDGQH